MKSKFSSTRRSLFSRVEKTTGQALAYLLQAHRRRRSESFPESLLLVKSCCMGDAILSLYAIREYKRLHPDIRIEALVSARIQDVYRSSPCIDIVHVLPITGFHPLREILRIAFWKEALRLVQKLYRRRFDLLIDLELYRGYGAALARVLGIPFSHGFQVPGTSANRHDFLAYRGKAEPEWQCFYKVMRLPVPTRKPEPLYPRPMESPAKNIFPASKVGLVFGASANWPQKRWPLEHFAYLARELTARKITVVLFGSESERKDAQWLQSQVPQSTDTSGQLDWNGLIGEISQCHLVTGNDTGTLHLASAVGIPVLTLFGPTSPQKWNPLTSRAYFVPDLNCRPCYYLGEMPACSHRNCLNQLRPESILQGILEGLSHGENSNWAGLEAIVPGTPPK